ncbi:MAG: hypothetical protein ACUZ77_11835 [Candidatus Brocadiales bacterium]
MELTITDKSVSKIDRRWKDKDVTEYIPISAEKELQVYIISVDTSNRDLQTAHTHTDNRLNNWIFLVCPRSGVRITIPPEPTEQLTPNSSWTKNYIECESIARLRLISSETVKRIKDFASLEENWDSYGAQQIKLSTIAKSIDFFCNILFMNPDAPLPFVTPVCDGSIHFEWEICSKRLIHLIPEDEGEPLEYIMIDKSSGKIKKTISKVFTMVDMLEIVSNWMKR